MDTISYRYTFSKLLLSVMILIYISLLLFGCHPGILSGPDGNHYKCSAEIWKCDQEPIRPELEPNIYLGGLAFEDSEIDEKCYPFMDEINNIRLYIDEYENESGVPKDVVAVQISDDRLKGAMLIQTKLADWNSVTEKYLEIKFKTEIDSLYVAYDSRAKIPNWLKTDYVRHENPYPVKQRDAYLTTSIRDPAQDDQFPVPHKFLTLDLYRYNHPVMKDNIVNFPGNNFEGHADAVKDIPLTYVVLIKPKTIVDCEDGNGRFLRNAPAFESCMIDSKDAENYYIKELDNAFPFYEIRNLNCEKSEAEDCTTEGKGFFQNRSYPYSSEIEFINPSSVKVTFDGNSHSRAVQGRLHFEFLNETHNLKLNSMALSVDPIVTGNRKFSDIQIYLAQTSQAYCQGYAAKNLPCDAYELKPSTFICGESFKYTITVPQTGSSSSKQMLFMSENSDASTIQIDHPSRTFTIQGNLSSSFDGKPIDVELNLVGKFVNFAPIPKTEESGTFSQCVERTNGDPINLYAGASFDVYEPLPDYKVTYKWYEDYGLLTEKLWGEGKKVTIGSGQLSFGVHDLTLVVRDSHGVAATTPLKVQVADTIPPIFTKVPPDQFRFSWYDRGPVKVNIGEADARDVNGCSSEVFVTNDAPEDLNFPSGTTEVTWRADDLRGNVALHTQYITLWRYHSSPGSSQYLYELLRQSINRFQGKLSKCGDSDRCFINMVPLVSSLGQIIDASAKVELPEPEKREVLKIASQLEPLRASLVETQQHLDRSNQTMGDRAQLRASARKTMHKALKLVPRDLK